MPWRLNIQTRSIEQLPMSMSHWNNGGTRSFAAAICLTIFLSTCSLWPAYTPPIDMIASHTMSRRSPESRRQAAATLFRVMLSYSGQTSRSQKFRGRLELIFVESIAGRADLRTFERSIGAVLQLTGDLCAIPSLSDVRPAGAVFKKAEWRGGAPITH